ncbi:MAG: methionyl-tRNA formyltransferase [Candidatus Acidiferrales bacterium]
MRLLFCGTPEFAVPTLRRLHAKGFSLAAVVTQPDRPKGRGLAPAASPVKQAAAELGLRVEQPEKLKGEAGRAVLANYAPEAAVIVGYGQLIPADLLSIPPHGWINLHASLLPKYRGAAPVQWALIRGERVTGVTTMRIDAGLDTGPILLQAEEPIGGDDTAPALAARLAERGAALVVETLRGLATGSLAPRPQDDSQASKAPLLKKEDGRVNWSLSAQEIYNRIRGLIPWPGVFTTFRGKNLHLWWAKPVEAPPGVVQPPAPGTLLVEKHALYVACGSGSWLQVEEVQPADRKRMRATDIINGLHVKSGERIGN